MMLIEESHDWFNHLTCIVTVLTPWLERKVKIHVHQHRA